MYFSSTVSSCNSNYDTCVVLINDVVFSKTLVFLKTLVSAILSSMIIWFLLRPLYLSEIFSFTLNGNLFLNRFIDFSKFGRNEVVINNGSSRQENQCFIGTQHNILFTLEDLLIFNAQIL